MEEREIELKKYEDAIKSLAHSHSDAIFGNEDIEHAEILMETIFDNTTDLKILSGGLNPTLTSRSRYKTAIFSYLDACTKKEKKIKILVMNEAYKVDGEVFKKIMQLEKRSENIELKKLDATESAIYQQAKTNNEGKDVHFCVDVEKGTFRCETDSTNYVAISSFNRQQEANLLNTLFDMLYESDEATLIS